jgi:paired amphipathic helix protein Sin3a
MNPAHRDGWPPQPAGVSAPNQQQTEQNQGQGPRLPGLFGCVLLLPCPPCAQPWRKLTGSSAACPLHAHILTRPTADPAMQASNPMHLRRRVQDQRCRPRPVRRVARANVARHVTDLVTGGQFYSSNAASAHNQNLPALPGLTAQPPHSSPHQSAQRPTSSEAGPGAQSHQGPQGPQYSLPGISQTLQQQHMASSEQANADRERELRERDARERDILESHALMNQAIQQQDELAEREAEQRDRELHERQQREQAAHQNHSGPIQIHQPVAVAPSTRTIHGPNGLLGQSGPLNGPNPLGAPMSGPNATAPMYGNPAVPHEQTTPRMQHAVQPPSQAHMLMPFTGPPGAMGMGQGQQPILNVSLGTKRVTKHLLIYPGRFELPRPSQGSVC